MNYLAHTLIIIGLVLILITLYGLEKHEDFSKRVLISSLTDSTALIFIFIGVILLNPFELRSLKIIFILALNLVLSPVLVNIIINNYGGRK